MTEDSIRRSFERMDNATLLATAAFFVDDYAPEAQSVLAAMAVARGIEESTIRQHRRSCYPAVELEFNCEKCNCELLLDRDAFVDAEYTCPDCKSCNPVRYERLRLSAPPSPSGQVVRGAAKVGGLSGGLLTGAYVALELWDARKIDLIRQAILDGTYWQVLRTKGVPEGPNDD